MQLGKHCYVPRLQVKQGEMKALSATCDAIDSGDYNVGMLFPLLEIPDINWDYTNGCPSDTRESFIPKIGKQIASNWSHPAFLDAAAIVTDPSSQNPPEALIEAMFHELHGIDGLIPVLHNLDTDGAAFNQVKALLADDQCSEVCLRLQDQQLFELTRNKDHFDRWRNELNIEEKNCHVILDLKTAVEETTYYSMQMIISNTLTFYPELDFTILGTAIPESSDIKGVLEVATRDEWNNWAHIMQVSQEQRHELPVAFGDYGTVGLAETIDVDPKMMNISGKFKYTTEDSWLVGKGGLFKSNKKENSVGGRSIIPIVRAFTADPCFRKDHCETDIWMEKVTSGDINSFGNPTTWITKAMTHHMLVTLEQVALI